MSSRKWWIVAVVLLAVVAAAAAAVLMRPKADTAQSDDPSSDLVTASAPELLQKLPRSAPELGVKITPKDVSAKATDMGSRIGVDGGRLLMVSGGEEVSWVYAVDTSTGKLAHPAVEIGSDSAKCLQNKPGVVLCVASKLVLGRSESAKTAWVIDVAAGKVTYQGTTDVDDYALEQVGQYAVGHTLGQGWWGVGAHAEKTWQVPGSGSGTLANNHTPTLPAARLAAGEIDGEHNVIFSAVNGRILTSDGGPAPRVYPGGYVTVAADAARANIYDEAGALLNTVEGSGKNSVRIVSTDLSEAVVLAVGSGPSQWRIFDRAGKQTADFPEPSFGSSNNGVQVVGGHFFTREYGDSIKQYDLKTGVPLKECPGLQALDIVGTDGTVFLLAPYGQDARAVDIGSCQVLWTLQSDGAQLVKVGDRVVAYGFKDAIALLKAA